MLILRSGGAYIRAKENGYLQCGIEKASVYPLEKLAEVRRQATELRRQGFEDISIRKLVLSEEPLEGDH